MLSRDWEEKGLPGGDDGGLANDSNGDGEKGQVLDNLWK